MRTNRLLPNVLAALACTLLGGCFNIHQIGSGEPDKGIPRMMLKNAGVLDSKTGEDINGNDCAYATPKTGVTTTQAPPSDPPYAACFWEMKSLIDYRYQQYKTSLLHIADDGNLAGDAIALSLSTAAVITPGATAAKLFSALAGGVLGLKSFVNEDVLYKQTITLIAGEMDSDRAAVATTNAQHLAAGGYTLPRLTDDMLIYYEAGTFEHAMQTLQAKTSQPASTTATAQFVTVTIAAPATGTTFTTGNFLVIGIVNGTSVTANYATTSKSTPQIVAACLADMPAFKSAGVTAVASGATVKLTYTTADNVPWLATGPGNDSITVSTQAAVPPATTTTPAPAIPATPCS